MPLVPIVLVGNHKEMLYDKDNMQHLVNTTQNYEIRRGPQVLALISMLSLRILAEISKENTENAAIDKEFNSSVVSC